MKHFGVIGLWWLIGLMLCATHATAQQRHVLSGRVTDAAGSPLSEVSIAVQGTTKGTYTDSEGRYRLRLSAGRQMLVVSYLGYHTVQQEVNVQKDAHLNFTLQEDVHLLQSVEVVGKTGAQKAREGIFAVNALDIKPLATSINSLTDMIDRTTGIKVREEGGVGSDFDLSINGMSGNSVRYFLDGMPLDAKGSGVSLSNLPVNIIDRIEIYKGVVPASLGADALGGAINIITKQEKKNYLDVSYGIGSFHTHKADLNGQWVLGKAQILVRPTVGVSYSKNDYTMKGVELWDEESRKYVPVNRKRFHDDYLSILGQVEVGVEDKKWADALFVSASYSTIDKEIQTGSIQTKVIGMANREVDSWNVSGRYRKKDFLVQGLELSASVSHTWDHSLTVDTAYRKYDWDGHYIESSRNEITGRARSMRHYKWPMTLTRANLGYQLDDIHSFHFNYLMNRTGNDRYDDVDTDFEPSDDVLTKHILGLTYNQTFWGGRWDNTFFAKNYINHLEIQQTDLSWITGSEDVTGSNTRNYWGYGAGSRYSVDEWLSLKLSYEHSVRLPLARELLGNGTTIYANVALKPESSHNVNLGIYGTWHPADGHALSYEANGFLRLVDDYIQAVVSEKEGLMQYQNVPAVHIKGVEGEMRYNWLGRLQLSANVSYQDARDRMRYKSDGKESVTYNNRVPNRPWLFGSVEGDYTFRRLLQHSDRLRLCATYNWVHWYFLSWEGYGALDSKARIPAQHVLDLSATYSWHGGRYSLSLQCNNVADRTVYDNYKLQKPGRSFFAKFRLFLD